MNEREGLLRSIPNVDRLIGNPIITGSGLPVRKTTEAVRVVLARLRQRILSGEPVTIGGDDELCRSAVTLAQADIRSGIRHVINGTGVVLHSNLGRACLSEKAALAVYGAARRYSTLEYDLDAGGRGSRTTALETRLAELTGAEGAVVVNNNAAAVLLTLTALCPNGQVVVSRGELVEIGGSFRVPEIMEQCGCKLIEVGTTNKTHLSDYERAAYGADAILKVHTSNYRIVGFTSSVPTAQLIELAHNRSLPFIEDIGSGALLRSLGAVLGDEPFAADSISAGADIVCFSGDKLLGGAQAGIILGRAEYIKKLRSHPLYRALRVGKLTIAALEETLRAYLDPCTAASELPVASMLLSEPEELRARAEKLSLLLSQRGAACEVVPVESSVGGGAAPCVALPSFAVSLSTGNAALFERRLRGCSTPLIGRIVRDRFLIDVRTVFDDELGDVAEAVTEALQ